MNTNYKIAIAVIAGAAIGGAAIQGLHAQAKPKAYVISELIVLNADGAKAYAAKAEAAQIKAGATSFRTGGGTVTTIEGAAAPARVAINEFANAEIAAAFYKSKEWTDMTAERNSAVTTIRRYMVEAR